MTANEIQKLADLGLTGEQMAFVARMMEQMRSGDTQRKEKDRLRKKLYPPARAWAKLRSEVFIRDQFRCVYCGAHGPSIKLVCDHVIPVSKGGPNEVSNLVACCLSCNSSKSNRSLHVWNRRRKFNTNNDA